MERPIYECILFTLNAAYYNDYPGKISRVIVHNLSLRHFAGTNSSSYSRYSRFAVLGSYPINYIGTIAIAFQSIESAFIGAGYTARAGICFESRFNIAPALNRCTLLLFNRTQFYCRYANRDG